MVNNSAKKAVVLLSGGLDSATTLYLAKDKGYRCFCLIFDYGQRHIREIECAKKIARGAGCAYQIVKINFPWKGSSLLDRRLGIPLAAAGKREFKISGKIPNTYVPGRNIIFLSFALSYAESLNAEALFIGANAIDYSGYPDCRPDFYRAFNQAASAGTKAGARGRPIRIIAPLLYKTKAQIIKAGQRLGVPYEKTWSCYKGGIVPCGRCDSCILRLKGFKEAGLSDPLEKKYER